MTTDPTAAQPTFVSYSTADGLASDFIRTVAEDDFGHIYLGTNRGLDQLDTSTGRIRHFTTADGLAGDVIYECLKGSSGNIWTATNRGVSRLNPRALRLPTRPPSIFLRRVQVAGEDLPLAETGALKVPQTILSASENNVFIEYVGLDFQSNQPLRYQYKLEGVDAEWSASTEQRSINYARLAPGTYRFVVRAINQEGIASVEPGVMEFRILPPVWQRWWFITIAAMLVGLIIYASHRYRVARLIELERVRTRIATDLHDDIGSNLSQIALLSEVVRKQVGSGDSQVGERLSLIAAISRKSVEAMGDIVWAINPNRDRLGDLTKRMRLFADEVLSARDIVLEFRAPTEDRVRLGVDMRRELFLVFKEAINNTVRHSGCSEVEIEFEIENGWLKLKVSDNGRGFDLAGESDGHGLASMRERARKIGGQVEVASRNGKGTTVTLRAPLGRRS
jgi:signal transduction histidine kinase